MKSFSGIKLSLLFSIMVFIIQSINLSTVPIFWFTAVRLGIFEDTGPFPPTCSIIVTSYYCRNNFCQNYRKTYF